MIPHVHEFLSRQSATPSLIEDTRRRINQIDTNIDLISQENVSTGSHQAALDELLAEREVLVKDLAQQEEQWQKGERPDCQYS